jgi:hypothetical protein
MKKIFFLTAIVAGLVLLAFNPPVLLEKTTTPVYKEGDIIFQSSSEGQGLAIQLATHSPYSHVGMIIKQNNQWMVLEAIQPVCITPLQEFIDRGDDKKYVVKRLKEGSFTGGECLETYKKKNLGKPYDAYFGWGDDRLYCSELVWKVYKNCCNKEIGKLEMIKDLDLSNPIVQYKLKERYGKNIPYEEKVISPGAMFDSELLMEVYKK